MAAAEQLTPYSAYLTDLETQKLTPIQYQVIQGFFYGVYASILDGDILHDVDHVLGYAGADFIAHYRSHCASLHATIAHLAAVIPSADTVTVEEAASSTETWFLTHVPAPYNRVFTRLSDGEEVLIVDKPVASRPTRISAIRKTMKRRRRAHTPPPAPASRSANKIENNK